MLNINRLETVIYDAYQGLGFKVNGNPSVEEEKVCHFQIHCSKRDPFDITLSLNSEAQVTTANNNSEHHIFNCYLLTFFISYF